MQSVSVRDAAALLELVAELDHLDDPLAFPSRFLGRLARLIGTGDASFCELDRRHERFVLETAWTAGTEVVDVVGDDDYWRLRHSHPVCSYRERTGDWTTAYTVSQFASASAFRRTEIWNAAYRDLGVNYWLDIGLPVHRGHSRVFIFVHATRDFGDRERLLLRLLEPHLERRAATTEATQVAVDALATVEDAGDRAHDVVLATAHGTIEFASARARALLARYLGVKNGTLPGRLLDRTTVARDDDGGRLTIRAARVDGLVVLLLGEDDGRAGELTPRQREVLAGVAAGLTDGQIAERLGIAPATVGKHLEAIYERPEVHTRTAAAAVYRR